MSLKHNVKVGDKIFCYGSINGPVHITEETQRLQAQNPRAYTFFIEHDGEVKEVSERFLYHTQLPIPEQLIKENMEDGIRNELKEEGLL